MVERRSQVMHGLVGLGMTLLLAPAPSVAAVAAGTVLKDVAFSHYGTFSSNPELARRLLTPATAARIEREVVRAGKPFAGQAINLAAEKFIVYVPSQAPARGYTLLVFVPPWQAAGLPQGWAPILDSYGAIFVSAARSGNDENTMGRREPLALLAAQNIIAQYPVDPERVYIAGFSGGSRIAQRLALGYPDLFRGAILNAGSDSIGDVTAQPPIPLPPRELFFQFQSGTRLVYITGARDTERVDEDLLSVRSMREWCVFNVENITEPLLGHAVAQPSALSRALASLTGGVRSDPGKLARCRSTIEAELAGKFQKVESLIASGKRAAADKLLDKIDQRYGGLAAPHSLELAEK
ncbi:MAG TPA: PHB depolymerase family esterase [Steroidobacteraceae bacterium]|nr:PHB depolymerase family esterase [Steroidobacteraceae bacterium]